MSKIIMKKCKKPNLPIVKMKCDGDINVKLEKYELSKLSLNKYCTTAFIGQQGSGKTSVMINLLTNIYNNSFKNIYVFMPKSSRDDVENNILVSSLLSRNSSHIQSTISSSIA